MLKSREHKKNKDTNSVIGGGNNVKKEEINTSNECVMAQENVQIQIQPCYHKLEELNCQNQVKSHIEYGFVSEDREGDSILYEKKI